MPCEPRPCAYCGKLFTPERERNKSCSRKCGRQVHVLQMPARFWSYVDMSGGPDACWPWTKARKPAGYGVFQLNRRAEEAHRVAFELANGAIDPKLMVLHSCEGRYPPGDFSSRACCNPAHLTQGTSVDNMRHRNESGRTAKGDRSGLAKLKDADVLVIRERRAMGELAKTIAADFGIADNTVLCVVNRRTWRHVQ